MGGLAKEKGWGIDEESVGIYEELLCNYSPDAILPHETDVVDL